jgi:hypothetical protein
VGWDTRPVGFTSPGGVAQLVAHRLCKAGVVGSSPIASTRAA